MAATVCGECGVEIQVGQWPWCSHEWIRPAHYSVHASERSVVWRHPKTGEIRYPGRNDVPMPERYREQGFERTEFASLRALEKFEASQGVRNEAAWFDRGSGRGFEDAASPPEIPSEVRRLIREGQITIRPVKP